MTILTAPVGQRIKLLGSNWEVWQRDTDNWRMVDGHEGIEGASRLAPEHMQGYADCWDGVEFL